MREIKFRVWDNELKKFPFIGFDILGETTIFDVVKQYSLEKITNNTLTIEQYTGLKDKNGVEIYEGDQLHICAGYSSTVEFQDGMFVSIYKHPEDGEIIPLIDAIGKNTIIIGNIHQIIYK